MTSDSTIAQGSNTSSDYAVSWTPVKFPPHNALTGKFISLRPLDVIQADDLWIALQEQNSDEIFWNYLPYGPFSDRSEFDAWVAKNAESTDPQFYAIIDNNQNKAMGMLSYLRIDPANGVIEIGHLAFGKSMQRSPASTEAVYLLIKNAFELGNRRVEWKCNAANERSKKAAKRFGFGYEGTFRKHLVVKGRNRDTAWFAILDDEWEPRKTAFEKWLSGENFDENGNQKRRLEELRTGN